MTNFRILILLLPILLLALLVAGSAQAQQPAENAALREKAHTLLESVASQIGTLQSAENRARLGANVADSLWPHDEKLARSLFLQVEADIRAELQKWQPQTPYDPSLMVFLKLRAETIERIAKHDGAAALAFLKATEIKADRLPILPYYIDKTPVDKKFEIRFAQKLAADNPDAAVELGRRAMERGFSFELFTLLMRLNHKHKDSAQAFYKEMVRKLQQVDLVSDWNARQFAGNLVQGFRPPVANETIYRELISAFVTTALAIGCAEKTTDNLRQNYCQWVVFELPEIEKFDARAARFRHWGTPDESKQIPIPTALYELAEVMEAGTTDEILAAAAKYPEYAERVYIELIDRARHSGNFDEVRRLINNYITDPEKKRHMLAQLDKAPKKIAIDEAMLAQLEEGFNSMPMLSQRVSFLLMQAEQFAPSDRSLALKLLDRASDLIDTMKADKAQTSAQIALAEMYCHEKHERGMGIMESLVPRLNELVEHAAKLDGYDTNYLRDGEWNMSANGNVGALLTQLSQNATLFAWCDFDRAVSIASRFERHEIRMMAQIRLAQGILSGPPKRTSTGYNEY